MALFWRQLSPFQWWCLLDLVLHYVTYPNTWNGVAIYLSCVMVSKDLLVRFMVGIGNIWTVMQCIAITGKYWREKTKQTNKQTFFFGCKKCNALYILYLNSYFGYSWNQHVLFFSCVRVCVCVFCTLFQNSHKVFVGNFNAWWPVLAVFECFMHYSRSVAFGCIHSSSTKSDRCSINSIQFCHSYRS